VDVSSLTGGEVRGLGVTDEGRVFALLAKGDCQVGGHKQGLYELKAVEKSDFASLTPVEGTVISYDVGDGAPEGNISRLWGADGNELVVMRKRDGWGLSRMKVIAAATKTD